MIRVITSIMTVPGSATVLLESEASSPGDRASVAPWPRRTGRLPPPTVTRDDGAATVTVTARCPSHCLTLPFGSTVKFEKVFVTHGGTKAVAAPAAGPPPGHPGPRASPTLCPARHGDSGTH